MTFNVDGVYVRVHPTKRDPYHKWVAYAKRAPFVLRDDPAVSHILEPGDMWFEFGNDPDAMIATLVAEVKADS